jgi:hypothetical protein
MRRKAMARGMNRRSQTHHRQDDVTGKTVGHRPPKQAPRRAVAGRRAKVSKSIRRPVGQRGQRMSPPNARRKAASVAAGAARRPVGRGSAS